MVTVTELREMLEELEEAGSGDLEVRFASGMSFSPRHTGLAVVAAPVGERVMLMESFDNQQEYLEQEEVEAVLDAFDPEFGL